MTFYEMITGTVPFKDLQSDFDIRESIIRKDTVKPSVYNDKIPVELEKIVMKSIEKNPEDRYQTTGEMLEEVRKFEAKSPDIESDFTLVEINEPVRHTESEFKFGKLPGPRSSKSGIKSKKYIRNIGIISSLIAMILILMYFFYPSTTPKRKPVKETVRFSQLTLLTQPSSATVIIDNDSIGKSPINKLSLKPGRYSLKISKADYFPIDTTVVLKPGNNLSLSFLLKSSIVQNEVRISEKVTTPTRSIPTKSVSNALIKVNSEPGAAEVYINGKFKGNTPLNIADIPPGEYQLTFKKDGYAINQNQVNLKSGQNRDLNVNLSPLTGSLHIITNPPSANVIIDGKKTTDSNTPVKLDNIPVGKHKLEVQKDGYASITEEIEVKEGETVTKTIDLIQQQGKLTIQVRPWGSIFIDDEIKKESADTKYEVTLPVKEYKITVTHPTLGRWEKTISLGANSEEEIIVNFNRNVTVSIAAFDDKGFPLNAEIIIDNETTGKSTPADIKVRPGNHKLSLKLDGYNTEEEKLIFVDKDESNEHTIILKKTE
jgi:serine/threonine protein kinase